jgi:hypothetical protein
VKALSAEFFAEFLGKTILKNIFLGKLQFSPTFKGEKFRGIFQGKLVRKIDW